MAGRSLICAACGQTFELSPDVAQRYPEWTPSLCRACHRPSTGRAPKKAAKKSTVRRGKPTSSAGQKINTIAEVLERYADGPQDGIFTDGACSGNPGPGGWGVVWVANGKVIAQDHGHEADTTNNRMELAALIRAFEMTEVHTETTIYSDSNLCVRTINEWARGWERRGWKRKTGPVQNLDQVRRAYQLSKQRPNTSLQWIKAHDGSLWNEYADALATAYLRDEL